MINELVERLANGKHQVVIGSRGESYEEIKQRIEDGYIHIKFSQTKGETELGINVDLSKANLAQLDFINGTGVLHIEGTTNLNYHPVRCIAEINLSERKGEAYLVIL